MIHFASLGGVLHLWMQLAGGVLSSLSHTIHTFIDTPLPTAH